MFKLIAGPCVVESEKMTMTIAEKLKDICRIAGVDLIFKASYRKANRTSIGSFEGIGDVKALIILKKVHAELDLKVITDVHTSEEVSLAAEYVDMLQIPAFLCRQTDLIKKASKTGLPINIKKGQFASADTMKHAVQKARECGASEIMITERGTTFGYSDLIVDMRNIPIMNTNGTPVFVDITHSTGLLSGSPRIIETIGKCAIAAGANGIFLETHPDPKNALSDAGNMLNLDLVKDLLMKLTRIYNAL